MGFTKTRHSLATTISAAALTIAGCDRAEPTVAATSATVAAPTTAPSTGPRIVFVGDSLTAGYGVESDQAFPALVGRALRDGGVDATIVNAGVSGDTTAGGLRRIDWVLRQKPDVLVVCLGGNDGLRRLDVAESASNLRKIVERGKSAGASVLLLGMLLPTNYGPEYRERFAAIFPEVAKETGAALVPFVLEGVGGVPDLNQPDGIHPTPAGHKIVAKNVVGALRDVLAKRAAD